MKYLCSSLSLLFLILSFNIFAQVICLEFESPALGSTEELPDDVQSLIGQSIEISASSIYFQDVLSYDCEVDQRSFSGKAYLDLRYPGVYDLSEYSDSIYGQVKYYGFTDSISVFNSAYFKLIKFKDRGLQKYFLHFNDYIFEMVECPDYEACYEEGLRIREYDTDSILSKQARYKSEIILPQFEIDQRGRHYASYPYSPFRITPAQFETIVEEIVVKETNVCPEYTVEYETKVEEFLVKDGYSELEIVPAIYDSVPRMELHKEGYNRIIDFIPHDYSLNDSCIVSSAGENIGFEQIAYCPDGYEARLSGCYKIDSIGPEYVARKYLQPIKVATIKSKDITAIYEQLSIQRIKYNSKKKIPKRCIKSEIIEWHMLKLAMDAEAPRMPNCGSTIEVPYYKKVAPLTIIEAIEEDGESIEMGPQNKFSCDSEELVSVEVVCEKFMTDAMILRIIEKLRQLDYDIPIENNQQEYYEALTAFQIKNKLAIGVLSNKTLEVLEIEY